VKRRAKLSPSEASKERNVGGAQLEVRLLGPLEVTSQGREVQVGGPKPRALLAALALEPGRVVSVDRLLESLWPGDPPDTAAHAVQVYVSQLRKALGEDVISTTPPGYAFELDPESVDVHRFLRLASEGRETLAAGDATGASSVLRDALALWRGPALADFTYEPFAQAEIARLEDLRTVAVEERIEADLALARHAELVSELEALVESQPLRERPRAQLMLALYRSGRQADALAAYRAARETLVEELGIDPGPALRELEAAILRQDESLLLDAAVAAAKPAMQFRRLVTVLFVDMVESMALAEALDAEALGRVLERYFDTVSAAITRHGGTVEKYAGDAAMAAFGIPVSHEDDAMRAARAAFDIQAGVAALSEQFGEQHGIGLEVRIGIAAGEVVATATDARQRFVAGDAVGVAARLEQAADAGEIVVGEVVARLIDHAARLEPLGELGVPSRRAPIQMFRLAELTPVGPAFKRRLDVALVGRKRELAALRRSLKRAVDGSRVQVALVVGTPGVGKSRIAAELARRTKDVTALFGRCLSYGDGITYWPLREAVQQAPESDEHDAILAALEADTPPPAPEIAWRFRRFCEALAKERPLVLVLDDLHWAEPTFLELVEHLADKGAGPMLVVCVAREELVEEHPAFLEGRENVDRIVVDALAAADAEALVDRLGGTILESDQRARIVEAAEGNPLFLEQLLALALEGGLGERPLPETIQALLAARLDRLGPGERAVLERGAVVGKEFTAADVVSLVDPEAVPTVGSHLATLSARGFVRPRGEGAFAFRHGLVQEAVYRAAPKRVRAELHERFADQLDRAYPDLPELDEFVGHHLEQGYFLRGELGEADEHVLTLGAEASRRLGSAGTRAFRRGDVPATISLLSRSVTLTGDDDPVRRRFVLDVALARYARGDWQGADNMMRQLITDSRDARDDTVEAWARMELEYIRVRTEPGRSADHLLDAAEVGIGIFEEAGEYRALARAWVFVGWVHGGHRSNHTRWAEAAERALEHSKAAAWPTSTSVGELAAALYWGPTPVRDAVRRCEQLLRDEPGPATNAYLHSFLGGLVAQQDDFERARELVRSAQDALDDLGLRSAVLTYCRTVLGEIELLGGDGPAAELVLRDLCDELERSHNLSQLASRASDLAESLVMQGAFEEAEEWTRVAERHAASDDVNAQMMWRPVRARVHARRGAFQIAEDLAREGVRLSDLTDDLNRRAEAYRDLGEVLLLAGRASQASEAVEQAVHLHELKGNIVGARRARELASDLAMA
jgi:DNA-binding SARP family transcriptional activator